MPKFRRKPIEVDAVQYRKPGDHPAIEYGLTVGGVSDAIVKGAQGWVRVNLGDWIIKEPDGSGHYPCNPDIFAATHDPA